MLHQEKSQSEIKEFKFKPLQPRDARGAGTALLRKTAAPKASESIFQKRLMGDLSSCRTAPKPIICSSGFPIAQAVPVGIYFSPPHCLPVFPTAPGGTALCFISPPAWSRRNLGKTSSSLLCESCWEGSEPCPAPKPPGMQGHPKAVRGNPQP